MQYKPECSNQDMPFVILGGVHTQEANTYQCIKAKKKPTTNTRTPLNQLKR